MSPEAPQASGCVAPHRAAPLLPLAAEPDRDPTNTRAPQSRSDWMYAMTCQICSGV
jgi:hypothetical protein